MIYARGASENPVEARIPGRAVEQAEWVTLRADLKDAEKIVRVHPVEDMPAVMAEFSEQVVKDLNDLWARKPMTAFAPDSVCQYCEARGICRKGMW